MRRFSLVALPIAICSFILSRVRARVHGRTHSRAMALVLRGARAAGVLKQVATAPLAQVRSLGRAVPGPVANVVFVEKPRPACLLIRPRFRSMSARATHPFDPPPRANAGQRRARLQRHHGGTRGHGLARTRARAPHRSGTSSTDELSDAPSRHHLEPKKTKPHSKTRKTQNASQNAANARRVSSKARH